MKPYIISISILFLIGTYFFIVNNEESNISKKVKISKEYSDSIDTEIKEKQKINNNEKKVVISKKEVIPKQLEIKENQEVQFFDENLAPLDLLDRIFSFKHGNKNEIIFQQITNLESILISQLKSKSEEETYSMFKKLLDLEEITIEDKKYIVDLLEAIGTDDSKALLVEMYQNSDSDELKEKIARLNTPEVYTLLALEATQNGDSENYQLIMNKLNESDEEQVVSGFMAFTKNDDFDTLESITQLASQWSSHNLSQRSAEITEDYLARADVEPKKRMVAVSILANMQNTEERDRILKKALEYEENEDVINSIQTVLDSGES